LNKGTTFNFYANIIYLKKNIYNIYIYKMSDSEIFVTDEKPIEEKPVALTKTGRKKRTMSKEAKEALLERLRLGRVKAKEKRAEARKKKVEEVILDDDDESETFFNDKINEHKEEQKKAKGKFIKNAKQKKYKEYIDLRVQEEFKKLNRQKKEMKAPKIEQKSVATPEVKVNILPSIPEFKSENYNNNQKKEEPKKEPIVVKPPVKIIKSPYKKKRAWA